MYVLKSVGLIPSVKPDLKMTPRTLKIAVSVREQPPDCIP